jgi:hypothetical protein
MSYDLHIVRPADFVRLDAHGRINLEESRRMLASVARECAQRGVPCTLIDARDVEPGVLSLNDLYLLAREFRELGFEKKHRLAILHRYSSSERAEFFAMCASDGGWDVRAFENFEEAIDWLNEPTASR